MKKVILSFAVAALALGANAQDKVAGGDVSFGIGARVALPMGDFSKSNGIGIGGEAQVQYMFSDKFAGVGSIGYTTYSGKDFEETYSFMGQTITQKFEGANAAFIPVLVGARYFVAEQFFVGAKVGYAVSAQSGGTGGFSYEPQVGFNAQHFQATVGYNGISANGGSISAIGASLIYKF